MLAPNRIRFCGVFSNELNMPDLIMDCAFESDNSEVSTFLTREAVASETYDGRNRRISSFKYTENFAPKFTFIKQGFGDFTQNEVRSLLKYLTSKDTTGLLEAYDDDSNVISWASIGNFTEIQLYKLANKRTVGVTAVWDSISPFALSDLHTVTKTIANPTSTTMYLWTPTAQTGTVPSYFLTFSNTVAKGDKLYTFTGSASTVINKDAVSLHSTVSDIQDSTYTISGATFTLSSATTVTIKDTNNKIVIEIDTDDNKPVYPCITINHGYNPDTTSTTSIPHTIVQLPCDVDFDNIAEMANYVENTVYHNATTGMYYYKSYMPQFTSSTTCPEYVDWETEEVDEEYTEDSEMDENTFYHYAYANKYYWTVDGEFYTDASRPVYGDWITKSVTKAYTASDTFEAKTIYKFTNGSTTTYYWMAPYNFYKSSTKPGLSTTSVKITNQHYDFFNQPSDPVTTIVKNNMGTEKIELDGANKIVSSDRVRRIFGDDFNLQHLALYDGKNEITIEGNCEITLKWREVRKVGEY